MGDAEGVPLLEGASSTALHNAVKENNIQAIQNLLASGIHAHFPDQMGRTPLHWALVFGHEEAAKLLISSNQQSLLNFHDGVGCTSLHYAAASGQVDTARMLIERGVEINAVDFNNRTPLHYAAQNVKPGMVELLVSRGAAKSCLDVRGDVPCDVAVKWGSFQAIACLKPNARESVSGKVHAVEVLDKNLQNVEKPPRKGPSLKRLLDSWRIAESDTRRNKDAQMDAAREATIALNAALKSWRETEARQRLHAHNPTHSYAAGLDAGEENFELLQQSLNDLTIEQSNPSIDTLQFSFAPDEAGTSCMRTEDRAESQTYSSWCTEWEVESDNENSEQISPRERKPQATDTTVVEPVWVQVFSRRNGRGEGGSLSSPDVGIIMPAG